MRTSLGMASLGLLDRGTNESLHIASIGMLRNVTDKQGGPSDGAYKLPSALEKQILQEDEIAIMVAMAFVEVMEK